METGTLVQLARGRNKWLAIIALCCCCTTQRQPAALTYYNAAEGITTKRGITYLHTTPVTGVVCTLNEGGDTIAVVPYVNGKEHGYSRYYHATGQLKAIRYYENGWKENEHRGWFENGRRQFIYHFKNDKFHGNQKEWLSHGQVYSDLNYEDGMENGSQRVWYPNGKIKTNYIIKGTRRYGLLGTKNCINASDSIFNKL